MSDKQGIVQKVLTDAFGTGDENPGYLYFDPKFMKHPLYKKAQDFTNGVYQGFTTGFSDELSGLLRGAVYGVGDWFRGSDDGNDTFVDRFKRGYQEGRDLSRKEYAASMNRSPFLTTTGEFAGTFSNPYLMKGSGYVQGARHIGGQMLRGGVVSMPYGAAYGIGKSTDQTFGGMVQDALIGAGLSIPASLAMVVPGLYNLGRIKYGKYQIKKALDTKNYKDVYFGRLAKQDIDTLNKIRKANKQPLMQNNKVTVPENVIKKWEKKRIQENHWTSQKLVDNLEDVFYSGKSTIMPSKYPHVQTFLNKTSEPRVGFISINPQKPTQNVIKSIYHVGEEDLNRTLFGPK